MKILLMKTQKVLNILFLWTMIHCTSCVYYALKEVLLFYFSVLPSSVIMPILVRYGNSSVMDWSCSMSYVPSSHLPSSSSHMFTWRSSLYDEDVSGKKIFMTMDSVSSYMYISRNIIIIIYQLYWKAKIRVLHFSIIEL